MTKLKGEERRRRNIIAKRLMQERDGEFRPKRIESKKRLRLDPKIIQTLDEDELEDLLND